MPTTGIPSILTDAGYLFWAPLATAEPAHTVTASKFTDSWPVAWISLGATEDGSEFSYETKVSPISVAEYFDPIKFATTERLGMISFNLADFSLTNYSKALNGAASTLVLVSGTGATALTSLVAPVPGAEIRSMIGWESLDSTMRLILYQTIQGGAVKSAFKKAPAIASIPCVFNLEVPASGVPFKFYGAGTTRD